MCFFYAGTYVHVKLHVVKKEIVSVTSYCSCNRSDLESAILKRV